MGGPITIARPSARRVHFQDMADILLRQGEAIQELARSTATDFQTLGTVLQQTRGLLTDALVMIEALKIQNAGLLAEVDRLKARYGD